MSFRVHQSLWGMTALPHGDTSEWTIPEKITKAVESGFDGVDIVWMPFFPSSDAIQIAQERGVDYGMTCFPKSVEDFKGIVDAFGTLDPAPTYVNVQPDVRVLTVAEGASILRRWLEIGADADIGVLIETHRDRMTTDLRFTLQLMDEVPEMRMTADLSHFVVGQEFGVWPVSEENHALIRRVIERSDAFHGRVATREQVQITAGWEHHREWLELFTGWWEEGFRLWRQRSEPDACLYFVTELGPPWYAITGQDGSEPSDRWEDALFLQKYAREIWQRVESESSP